MIRNFVGEGKHLTALILIHKLIDSHRSSVAMRLNSLAQVGGVNSIENFAKSWTRAAGFHEVTPQRPAFVLDYDKQGDEDETIRYGRTDAEQGGIPRTSLLRAHLDASSSPENAIDDESLTPIPGSDATTPRPLDRIESENKQLGSDITSMTGSVRRSPSIFAVAPHLATPLAGSYGTSYGTLRSSLNESSMAHAGHLWRQQQKDTVADGAREPIIVKEVEQDGKLVLVVAGRSTLPQTVFNSTNVLIGVGLLSLPMGIKYAGWLCGMAFLLLSALVTAYTARLLAKCMDVDGSLITFADLAFVSYGQRARIATSVLFTLELLAACVALVVLFADTLQLLIPGVGVTEWKIICGLLLIPLNFTPMRLLSFSSVIGILSCFSSEYPTILCIRSTYQNIRQRKWTVRPMKIPMLASISYHNVLSTFLPNLVEIMTNPSLVVMIVFIDGFIKPHTPGSLREPAETYLFPSNWLTLPLSFGLLMSPWGGHSVFPNIYRDMRHPKRFPQAVKVTFTFTVSRLILLNNFSNTAFSIC